MPSNSKKKYRPEYRWRKKLSSENGKLLLLQLVYNTYKVQMKNLSKIRKKLVKD